ncbi:hypothetical protein [Tenacibaculum sp.]|uniref:hypothetical protein n=1 Tax=Tenacibaculum sp. TaxID=1906242 RepID=UPI003D0B9530
MSLDFIKNKTNCNGLDSAVKQQEQISYFTQSSIQGEINLEYLKEWSNRKYITNDYFLNWVKAIFKTENFLSFYKYLRYPLASASLVNDKIKEPLARVFHADDSYFKYTIRGNDVDIPEELEADSFNEKMFNALLFNYNDILVHDLIDINKPYRDIIPISNIVAIDSKDSIINKIAYTATAKINGIDEVGYLYMDSENYIFYNKSLDNALLTIPHDLKKCPADFISKEPFKSGESDVVRKSIFSYVREELEEYTFLKTLQRMTEPNGAIPVVTQLDTNVKSKTALKGNPGEPMSANKIGSQSPTLKSEVIGDGNDSPLQTGTRVKVPMVKDSDGNVNMDIVKNYLNFFYTPVEALDYLNGRIQEIEKDIIVSILGDYSEANESAKNELQVSKSYENKQDKLRKLSNQLSRIRNLSDYKMLALKYGADSVMVDCFFGSDFFLESQEDIYNLFAKSPNPIERKNLLVRLSQNRNKYNTNKAEREKVLYELMPYASDKDFDKAIARGIVDDDTFAYQTRFTYWIGQFESLYGDIVYFWNIMEGTDSEKLTIINNLILKLIKDYYAKHKINSTPSSVPATQ